MGSGGSPKWAGSPRFFPGSPRTNSPHLPASPRHIVQPGTVEDNNNTANVNSSGIPSPRVVIVSNGVPSLCSENRFELDALYDMVPRPLAVCPTCTSRAKIQLLERTETANAFPSEECGNHCASEPEKHAT